MLAIGILQLLGILALSFLVTPFILSLIGIISALFVLTVTILVRLAIQQSLKAFPKIFKRFVWMKHDVKKEYGTGNCEVPPPDSIHNLRVGRKQRGEVQPIAELESRYCCKEPLNDCGLDRPEYPVINLLSDKFNKVLKAIHRLILFYRSYYGHSTKVEKNHNEHLID